MEHAIPPQLRQLILKADATAQRASAFVRSAIREIRGEIALLLRDLDVAARASDREKVYRAVHLKVAKLQRRLDALLRANLQYSGRMAASAASDMLGLTVQYSKRRADEVLALISPQQGKNLAAVFTEKMEKSVVEKLRLSVVSAFRENAVAGGSLKDLAHRIDEKWQKSAKSGETYVFRDASGKVWDTATYMQMNARTNAMRVYNDLLADNIARASGNDLVRVSMNGSDPHCRGCRPWEGRILSLSGETKDYPSYEDAKAGGLFHPNCVHSLRAVTAADAWDVENQRGMPSPDEVDDPTAQAFDLDVRREMARTGCTREDAENRIRRERLKEALRNGCPFEGAEDAADGLTDEEVARIVHNGHVPEFTPTKGREVPAWHRGSRGGVVHLNRDNITADELRRLMLGGAA